MPSETTSWHMHFYFADQEGWVKPPAPGYWQKQSIAKTKQKMAKPVIPATVVFLLMQVLL